MRSEIFYIILGMALVTYFTRFGALAMFRFTGVPAWLSRWFKYVPVAILTALIAPSLLLPRGYLDISFNNHYLVAGLVAAFVAYKSRNIIATLGLGMSVMFVLKLIS
ncbi:AzlD domain-containing protein [Desulforamulus hydrothermalis]|uniref:Branched-chain amino acid transport n=1 Tax=Desulforamulus hydrothermalis Lam5 = DSM 18033 TaxID=1121428 RepID=K8EH29_9FIRM|nr:AzlD domain-containing protein [Desulforamulus hydrothermalis]CCO07931.1 Branched-chain amino acid transport [Desulforamulus hydrothermalis Lam5 = DSM 18033]SHG85980.1 Branched-chain amino acid transport protein [Desulforamulus hydrothermalis Lam5 = DSM 18033]